MLEMLTSMEIPAGVSWRDALDITILTILGYKALLMIKGTRALATLLGLGILLFLYFISIQLELYTLRWLLEHIVGSLFLVIVILFQKDIRHGLGELGARYFWKRTTLNQTEVEEIVSACTEMARLRIGALIIIQRSLPLEDMIRQEGTALDATISSKLLLSIFLHPSPLHDGAVIIRKGRLAAASCILPLAVAKGKNFGTRHRAALGITEETDALAIVISEERGEISVVMKGEMTSRVQAVKLKEVIAHAL